MLPFDGIRIVDLTQLEQGPSGTQVLADFGAEVIKVERPHFGEIGRRQAPAEESGFSPFWAANNRNKKSVSIDLKSPSGRDVFERLAATADVVASNFRPGVMDRLGFGVTRLRELNPKIVVAYASGYGQDGPLRHAKGQDLAAQALGGVMALTGTADGPPTPVGTYIVDYVAAMHFAQAIMIGLAARDRTGEPQVVDVCLLNAAIAMHLQEASVYLNTGVEVRRPPKHSAHHRHTPLYGCYEAGDGGWVALAGELFVDKPWQRVCRALGMAHDLVNDTRFADLEGLAEHHAEAAALLCDAFKRLTRDEALKRLEHEDILASAVRGYGEVFADAQVHHNKMIASIAIDGVGTRRLVSQPIALLDGNVDPGRLAPPRVGEHNEQILEELGYDAEARSTLKVRGAVGDENDSRAQGVGDRW